MGDYCATFGLPKRQLVCHCSRLACVAAGAVRLLRAITLTYLHGEGHVCMASVG